MSIDDTAQFASTRGPGRPRDQVAHDAILNAAMSLLEECCYSEITIEKIAARAGVGKPTIYRRWKTKADLVVEAYASFTAASTLPVVPSGNVFDDLSLFLERMFIVYSHPINHRALRSFLAEAQFDEGFRRKVFDLVLSKRRVALFSMIDNGKALGQISRDVDNEIIADMIYGAFSLRLITDHGALDRAFAQSLVDLIKRGLAPRTA